MACRVVLDDMDKRDWNQVTKTKYNIVRIVCFCLMMFVFIALPIPVNSFAPKKYGSSIQNINSGHLLSMSTSRKIDGMWMLQETLDGKTALVGVMICIHCFAYPC